MTPGLRLLCACCRWPDDDARRQAIAAAAAAVEDWHEIASLADRHRVEPLVAHGLAAAGLVVPDAIEAAVRDSRALGLRDLAETLRVAVTLDQAEIVHRFLKGAPLGAVAYGSPLLKRSWDVDLLVLPGDAVAAASALADLGYRSVMPPRPLDPEEFARWSVVSKEAQLVSPRGTMLELHWAVSDHPHLLTGLDAAIPSRAVTLIGDRSVATLADSANLAYLAVHGSAHAWSRLKWIADFNAFLASRDAASRAGLIDAASRLPVGRALDTGLDLAARLFGSAPVAPPSPLVTLACAALASDKPDETERIVGKARWRLAPGFRFRTAEFILRCRGSHDRLDHPLPPHWQFLYPLLRIPFFIRRKIAQARIVG